MTATQHLVEKRTAVKLRGNAGFSKRFGDPPRDATKVEEFCGRSIHVVLRTS